MTDDCAAVEPLLVRAAEGTLSTEPRGPQGARGDDARLTAHLKDCASCRAALANQRAMRELLQGYPMEGARLGFDARVMAAIRAEAAGRSGHWLDSLDFRRWTWRLVPVAAALALASVMTAAPALGVINQTDTTTGMAGGETTMTANTSTDNMPVSSALWSESVSGSSLLSLMLTANADDALSTHRKDQ
jgi:anti-sigma factor RsiW